MIRATTMKADSGNAADAILGPALARGQANDVAIEFGDGRTTYAELNADANRIGNAFKPHLAKGDRALLLLKDSPLFIAAFLGFIRIGAVSVPLSTRLSAADLAFVMRDSEAKVLLIDDEFLPLLRDACAAGGNSPQLVVVRGRPEPGATPLDEMIANADPKLQSSLASPDDAAFWLYTSGSTGTPKAAVHCHGDVTVGDAYFEAFGYGPGERVFSSSKLFFAFALGHSLIGGLRTGSTVVLYEGWPDGHAIASVVEKHRPTIMLSVPAFFRTLLREGQAASPAFKEVRCYISAGESLPESLYRRWQETTGRAIVEGIGLTETVFMIVSGTPDHHLVGATGKPMPYAQTRLMDGEDVVTEPDTPGVLWTKMGSLCRGYWRQPDKTSAAFQDGWFRTGDVFVVGRDGWWRHQGRADDLLKISGQWVSPAEIEECAATVPGVAEAVVVGVPDADGLVRLAMFVVAADEPSEALKQSIQQKLLGTLSKYKCPRNIVFVDVVPRTATGKVRRFRLRDWLTADLLRRLMRALGLDMNQIAAAHPNVVIEMQMRCAKCENDARCAHDLDGGDASSYHEYCPNAELLIEMKTAEGRSAKASA